MVKNREIFIPHLYLANLFDTRKTRMIGLPCGEEAIRSRFHLIPACDGQTDRQTDGQTDIQNCYNRASLATGRMLNWHLCVSHVMRQPDYLVVNLGPM